MARTADIRVKKTKERLKTSLLSLLKEKSIEKISISEICSSADVNRNTFYAHYTSIEDLLSEIEGDFLSEIISALNISGEVIHSVKDLLIVIFRIIRSNEDMCVLLLSERGDKNFLRNILYFALPGAMDNWTNELGMDKEDAKLLFYFIVGGAVNILEAWLKDDLDFTIDELAEKMNALIIRAQSAFVPAQ